MHGKSLPEALAEKNAQDFEDITLRIKGALEKIRKNSKLKPTQAVLAKLAECSRGTINNRKWPLEELEVIKHERKEQKQEVVNATTPQNDEASLLEQYKDQLYKSREELRIWKSRYDEQAGLVKQLEHITAVLQQRIEILEKELKIAREARRANVIKMHQDNE